MAGSSVKLYYNTKIRPEKNARIEGLETYLASKTMQSITLNKYVKHDLSVSIKIDTEELGSNVWTGDVLNPFASGRLDYVAIKNDKDTGWVYYFVMNPAWTASKTVTLELALDTVNSFDGCYEFTDRTVVTRAHKSRYTDIPYIKNGVTYYQREFYLDGDGIQPQLYRTSEETITDSKADSDWYLLYMANNAPEAVRGDQYPVNAFLIGEEDNSSVSVTSYTLDVSKLDSTKIYWFGKNVSESYASGNVYLPNGDKYEIREAFYIGAVSGTKNFYLSQATGNGGSKQLASGIKSGVFRFDSIKDIDVTEMSSAVTILQGPLASIGGRITAAKTGTVTPSPVTSTEGINNILTVDRTDTRIISIIKLPYCPSNVNIKEGVLPAECERTSVSWQNGQQAYYLKVKSDFLQPFENEIELGRQRFFEENYVVSTLLTGDTKQPTAESALYRSDYLQDRFVYDSFVYTLQNERLQRNQFQSTNPKIKMVTTGTMNSRFLFDFNNENNGFRYLEADQSYPHIMSIARNNNITTFNSEYVNYMRNGYNYDVKAKNAALLSSGLGIAAGVLNTGVSIATGGLGQNLISGFRAGRATKAADYNATAAGLLASKLDVIARTGNDIGLATGLIGTFGNRAQEGYAAAKQYQESYNPTANVLALGQMFNGATSVIKGIESIAATERTFEQKQQQIKQASVSVSGSDDIDLLSYYSGNRMKLERWEASPRMKKALFDLYYYQGYATNEQKVPLHDNRKWFDFLQCQADIKNTKNLDQRYIDDLKDRFSIGVTYYHNNNGVWDIDQEKGNSETYITPREGE